MPLNSGEFSYVFEIAAGIRYDSRLEIQSPVADVARLRANDFPKPELWRVQLRFVLELRMNNSFDNSYLKRLEPEFYRGRAYVHWSLTIENRNQGWLRPVLLYKFRELLTHTTFRYGLCCPIFVLMPDHFHMMWVGILDGADQLPAMKHFRGRLNETLAMLNFKLQPQAFDNVLKDNDRTEAAFHDTCEYIARNPERAGLVEVDKYAEYKYTGCVVPGYPELKPFADDFWTRFWRSYSYLRKNGLLRVNET